MRKTNPALDFRLSAEEDAFPHQHVIPHKSPRSDIHRGWWILIVREERERCVDPDIELVPRSFSASNFDIVLNCTVDSVRRECVRGR